MNKNYQGKELKLLYMKTKVNKTTITLNIKYTMITKKSFTLKRWRTAENNALNIL